MVMLHTEIKWRCCRIQRSAGAFIVQKRKQGPGHVRIIVMRDASSLEYLLAQWRKRDHNTHLISIRNTHYEIHIAFVA